MDTNVIYFCLFLQNNSEKEKKVVNDSQPAAMTAIQRLGIMAATIGDQNIQLDMPPDVVCRKESVLFFSMPKGYF